MKSIIGDLLNSMGLTGTSNSALGTGLAPFPANNPGFAEKAFMQGGEVADPNAWNAYANMVKRPVDYEAMLRLWEEMSNWDLMSAALTEIVDEAISEDETCPGVIWYECNDMSFERELNENLLPSLNIETTLPSQFWHLAAFGNSFENLSYEKGTGVLGFSFAHPMDVRRYWLTKNRQCVGFEWKGRDPSDSAFFAPNGQPIARAALRGENNKAADLWYPWDFLHFRRMYRLRTTEHGEPIYDDAQGIYKKLRMAVDQMVVHRAQIQPDRYMVKIDTGDMPPNEQYQTVQRWKQSFRSNLSFGGKTTNVPEEFKSFYNAMSLDSVLWLPVPAGRSHSIEKLAGTTTIPDVYDIELLENLFFSILGMPKAYIKGPKDGQNPPSAKSLLAQDMRFLRRVKALRKPVIERYEWLAYFHAILKGLDPAKLEIKVKMSPIGGLEDAQRVETMKGQIEILTALGEVMTNFNLPRETWIEIIFKRYMHLPDDIVAVFLTALPMPSQGNQEENQMSVDDAEKLLVEAVEKDQKLKDGLATLAAFAMGKNSEREKSSRYRTAEDVLGIQGKASNTLFESSDKIVFEADEGAYVTESTSSKKDQNTPYYRKVMDARKR